MTSHAVAGGPQAVPLTFVSAIFDTGPSSLLGGRGWDISYYLPSLINIAHLGAPIVLYCPRKDVDAISGALDEHFRDWRVVPFELSRFDYYDSFLDWKETYWQDLPINDRNEVLCFLKSYWVQHAIGLDPFAHETFYWIDAGLTHQGIFPRRVGGVELLVDFPPSHYYPRNRKNIFHPGLGAALAEAAPNGKLFFCALPFTEGGTCRREVYEPVVAAKYGMPVEEVCIKDHLVGGLFGGHKQDLAAFHRLYAELLKEFIDTRTFTREEQVFSGLNAVFPKLFSLRRFATWWFYSPGEPTSYLKEEGDSFYKIFMGLASRGEGRRPLAPSAPKRIRVFLGSEYPNDWFSRFSRRLCEDFLAPEYDVAYASPMGRDPLQSCPIYEIGDRRCMLHGLAIAFQAETSGRLRLLTTYYDPVAVFRHWNFDPELVDRVYTAHYIPVRLRRQIDAFRREQEWGGATETIEGPWRRWIFRPLHWRLVERVRREPAPEVRADLYFRGLHSPARVALEHLVAHAEADDRIDVRWWHPGQGGSLEAHEYFRELRSHAIALSLPGAGDLCNRDIECFGLGVPVLRPVYAGELEYPLEAGVHYIGVPYEPLGREEDGRWPDYPRDPFQLAADLLATYRRVRDDEDVLRGLSTRALDYYERYCAYPASGQVTFELLDLDSL